MSCPFRFHLAHEKSAERTAYHLAGRWHADNPISSERTLQSASAALLLTKTMHKEASREVHQLVTAK